MHQQKECLCFARIVLSIIQLAEFFLRQWVFFQRIVVNDFFLPMQQGEQGVEAGSETNFKQVDFGLLTPVHAIVDKHMHRFLNSPVNGMKMLIQFGQIQRVRAVFGQFNYSFHTIKLVSNSPERSGLFLVAVLNSRLQS